MGMRLSPALFNRQLKQMGQAVEWRPARACPCRDPHSGGGRSGCPRCRGVGTFWAEAVAAWTGVSSMKTVREFAEFGQWTSGDIVLTVPGASPLHQAGEHDRITMLNSRETFHLVLTRDGTDQVRGRNAEATYCAWERPGDQALIEGPPPTIEADGSVTWPDPATAPEPGWQYTLSGTRSQEFFVFKDLPQDRSHFGGLPLPRRIQARRFDLFGLS